MLYEFIAKVTKKYVYKLLYHDYYKDVDNDDYDARNAHAENCYDDRNNEGQQNQHVTHLASNNWSYHQYNRKFFALPILPVTGAFLTKGQVVRRFRVLFYWPD